jgi:hypothetical protein
MPAQRRRLLLLLLPPAVLLELVVRLVQLLVPAARPLARQAQLHRLEAQQVSGIGVLDIVDNAMVDAAFTQHVAALLSWQQTDLDALQSDKARGAVGAAGSVGAASPAFALLVAQQVGCSSAIVN